MRNDDLGKFILRVTLGGLILLHGIFKIIKGPAAILGMVGGAGLPEALGYLVYVGEVVAPVLLILGVFARPAALVVAINMVVAILLVHTGQIMKLGNAGGWAIELQALFLINAIVVAILGAGSLRLGRAGSGFWA